MKRKEQMFERKIHLWKTITLGVGEATYLERVPIHILDLFRPDVCFLVKGDLGMREVVV